MTIENITLFWIIIGIISFPFLIKITAPYGRHSSKNWGLTINNKIGWIIMEFPALLVCPFIFFVNNPPHYSFNSFFILLWIIHYFNRTLIYPFKIKTKGKKMPLIIAFSAFGFNFINGVINGYFLSITNYYEFNIGMFLGFISFFAGLCINIWADNKLISLRSKSQPGEYVIPQGGLFNYVSCPNFFGEVLEWFGFAIMTWNLGSLSFFIWTFINLVPRALSHHNWYKEKFKKYPHKRKAIIPKII